MDVLQFVNVRKMYSYRVANRIISLIKQCYMRVWIGGGGGGGGVWYSLFIKNLAHYSCH